MPEPISAVERAMLDFENQYWRYTGAKERAIRESFGISATQYYLRLAELIERPEAMAARPIVVKKLLAQRDSRSRARRMRRAAARGS